MSDQLQPYQQSADEPTGVIGVFGAVAAGAAALVTALAVVPGVPTVVVIVVGCVAAVSTAVYGYYTKRSVRAQVTPWTDVAAKVTPRGNVIAGPAASQPTGTSVAVVRESLRPSAQEPDTAGPLEGDAL